MQQAAAAIVYAGPNPDRSLTMISPSVGSQKYIDLFKKHDKDGDGKLSRKELYPALFDMNYGVPFDSMMEICDTACKETGYVEMPGFIEAVKEVRSIYLEGVRGIFENMDLDGDGYISFSDFKEVANKPEKRIGDMEPTDDEIKDMIKGADADGDGKVSFADLTNMYGVKIPSDSSAKPDLPDEDLTDKDLPDEDLSDKDLSDEDLPDEDLSDKDLSDEDLSDKDLSDEDLSDEDLSDEDLPDEDLSDEYLPDEDLSDKDLSDEDMSDEDLSDEDADENLQEN